MTLLKLTRRAAVLCAIIFLSACSDPAPVSPTGPSASEVTIATQTWMTRNLDVAFFRNGDSIPEAESSEEWVKAASEGKPAWCYYKNDKSNGARNGKLYNWFAVNDPRGLAPEGWHIPSVEEWKSLIQFLGGEQNAGKRLKAADGWADPTNGDNSSGFWGYPAGARDDDNFGLFGTFATFWTATQDDSAQAWFAILSSADTDATIQSQVKTRGMSVRCLKN